MDPHRISSSQNCMSDIGNYNNPSEQLSTQGQPAIGILFSHLLPSIYYLILPEQFGLCYRLVLLSTEYICTHIQNCLFFSTWHSHSTSAALTNGWTNSTDRTVKFVICKNPYCCSSNNLLPARVCMIIDNCWSGFYMTPASQGAKQVSSQYGQVSLVDNACSFQDTTSQLPTTLQS